MTVEKILIVEDDSILAADLREIVSSFGFETSGIADTWETAKALAPFSTIALVDINLRDGATGPRIAQYLASEFGVAVVMVTGSPEDVRSGLLDVVGVISKPVHPTIIGKVLTYLQEVRKGGRGIPPGGMRLFG
ncbi:response regulator (plasmid) [Rhizobium grahamii]|uniref:Response regulator n=1 Tax=Rhizobium grahamii TaxID=1120045 RepID=A0A5Q0CE81_9HYPH|nr:MULTISPECIES: response regulator [Rhizobium]QFY62794.1 response regulator [Rhizobium grahamii]QRM52460.1 response regulator [Rhizobium sp. BG6]